MISDIKTNPTTNTTTNTPMKTKTLANITDFTVAPMPINNSSLALGTKIVNNALYYG